MTDQGKKKGEVNFSPPDTSEYQKRIDAAKSGHIPVGGVEMPKMPSFDQPPPKRQEGVQGHAGGPKAMSQEEYAHAVARGQAIPGVGAAYVANQPKGFVPPQVTPQGAMEMTSKDGNPVNPPRAEGGLRPETQAAVAAVAAANVDEKKGDDGKPLSKEDEDYIAKLADQTDDILRNKERREYIEKQITDELSFDDLLFNQELRQRVPIKKNFAPTFRTPSAAEDLFIKRLISKDEGSAQYIIDRYSAMGLVCGLFAINGKTLPDHLDKDKVPQEDLFQKKYDVVMKYPLLIIADLNANFVWFEERVKKLLSLDAIKGF